MVTGSEKNDLMVTIRCITYNHEPYIRQCLEGFVMQKTNFRFEAIVHDDASTDGTAAIVKEYAEKYPNIIKPIFETENQYSKRDGSIRRIMNKHMRGKYIAMCEGDDYWIDPLKLQKQVDFLETHTNFSTVFSNIIIRDERQIDIKEIKTHHKKRIYNLFDVLSGIMFGIHNICVKREVILNAPNNIKANGDLLIYYSCAMQGYIYRLDGLFSVYRLTGSGVASSRSKEKQLIAEIKERYDFHQQINFPSKKALILSQVRVIIFYLKENGLTHFPYNSIKCFLLKRDFLLYIYYVIKLTVNYLIK